MAKCKIFASFLVLSLVLFTPTFFSSCEEKEDVGEWDNWQTRNENYIDSIASVAKKSSDWTVLPAFNLGDNFGLDSDSKYYVYIQKLEAGTGTYKPMYNDSIRVHYSGRLIPTSSYSDGYNFGKSYSTSTLNLETDVPTLMCVNQNVIGFATAVMNMVEGDRWRIVVPSYLGYGDSDNTTASIPAGSALIFDVQLAKIYKYGIDTDTSWWVKRRK